LPEENDLQLQNKLAHRPSAVVPASKYLVLYHSAGLKAKFQRFFPPLGRLQLKFGTAQVASPPSPKQTRMSQTPRCSASPSKSSTPSCGAGPPCKWCGVTTCTGVRHAAHDYCLLPILFRWLDERWGPHSIDRFASLSVEAVDGVRRHVPAHGCTHGRRPKRPTRQLGPLLLAILPPCGSPSPRGWRRSYFRGMTRPTCA
jgi:hypothetical protein